MKTYLRIPHLLPLVVAGICLAAPVSGHAQHTQRLKITHGTTSNDNMYRVSNRNIHRYPHTYASDYRSPAYYRTYRVYRSYYRPGFLSYSNRPVSYTMDTYDYSPPYSIYSYGNSLSVGVQEALKVRGYYRGAIDGAIGPSSRFAIRSYQADSGLPVTGLIDTPLLRSLQIG